MQASFSAVLLKLFAVFLFETKHCFHLFTKVFGLLQWGKRKEGSSSFQAVPQDSACRMNLEVGLSPCAPGGCSILGCHSSIKRIVVPNDKVGLLMGKGGETVTRLSDRSGARICITKDIDADPYSGTRAVDLIGTPKQIKRAEELMQDFHSMLIKNFHNNVGRGPLSCDCDEFVLVKGFKVRSEYHDLYKAIQTTYGDIRCPSVLDASEMAVVWVVSDLLSIVRDMCKVSFLNMTAAMLDDWDKKICLAEHFNYNVAWIRDHFEELRTEFERKVNLDASVSESLTISQANQNCVESVEAEISLLISRLKSTKETLLALQSEEGEELLDEMVEEEYDTLQVQPSDLLIKNLRLLGSLLTSKVCFFFVFMFAMLTMFPQ